MGRGARWVVASWRFGSAVSCGDGRAGDGRMRTGDVGSGRASQRGSRTEALADPSMKRGGRGNARAAGWALARARGPTDAIKVSGENGRELTWQVNPRCGRRSRSHARACGLGGESTGRRARTWSRLMQASVSC